MHRVALHSKNVVLPEGLTLEVAEATVIVEGPMIIEVVRGPRGPGPIVDLGDSILAPAFVNAHTHLAMSAYRGIGGREAMRGNVVEDLYFQLEQHLQPGDVRAFTRVAAAECLVAGVGAVWDHYYQGMEVAQGLVDAGICGVVAPTLQDLDGPGRADLEDQIAATLTIASDPVLDEAGIVAALGPHATDTVSPSLWRRLADLASKHKLPFHVHAAQSAEEYTRSLDRHGSSPLRWIARERYLDEGPSALLVHGLFVDAVDLRLLDPTRCALGFCPASQMQYCFPAWTAGWRDAGFAIAVGTDCGACNDTMNVQQELRLVTGGPLFGVVNEQAYRDLFEGAATRLPDVVRVRQELLTNNELSAEALLNMVWGVPGGLHPGLTLGSIEEGCRANLLVFDIDHPSLWPGTDPLRAIALQDVAPAIEWMMVNGRWLSERGEHHMTVVQDPEYREAVVEARARLQQLLRSIGI